jgi:NAD(P)-dependent dehydrogenase (short-subunit alcohol dehydrogenase family)
VPRAVRYAQEGARVVIADMNEKVASELTDKLGNGAFAVQFDVTKQESIDNLVGAVVERAGRIDILVNNAGMGQQFGRGHAGPISCLPGGAWITLTV